MRVTAEWNFTFLKLLVCAFYPQVDSIFKSMPCELVSANE
jgi:hypothetical protein